MSEFAPPELLTHEAAICSFWAMIAVAYVYRSNSNFHGWQDTQPTDMAALASVVAPLMPNPAPGGKFSFSRQDLQLETVRAIIATRGPPKGLFECHAGQAIIIF